MSLITKTNTNQAFKLNPFPLHNQIDGDFLNAFNPENGPQRPRQINDFLACWVKPDHFTNPKLIAYSEELLANFSSPVSIDDILPYLSGHLTIYQQGAWATLYGGHQFGNWAGQLGDGRAMTMAYLFDKQNQSWEWQIKGAGVTPFSRGGDGYAVLRSSLREFLTSEAMHYLGVPTTRALALISTGELVERDILYTGNIQNEIGALCIRVSPSFLRFGHFQFLAWKKNKDQLYKLLDYTNHKYFHISKNENAQNANTHRWVFEMFKTIADKTINLVTQWLSLGFVHGVMNTDNMSIHGVTLDYGPFGWLDEFNPHFTPNSSDFREFRYQYINQYSVALWNLERLAESFILIDSHIKPYQDLLTHLSKKQDQVFIDIILTKIGLKALIKDEQDSNKDGDDSFDTNSEAKQLYIELILFLKSSKVDYTLFFRSLGHLLDDFFIKPQTWPCLKHLCYQNNNYNHAQLESWLNRWKHLILFIYNPLTQTDLEKIKNQMFQTNPLFILRNHLLYSTIESVTQDLSKDVSNDISKDITVGAAHSSSHNILDNHNPNKNEILNKIQTLIKTPYLQTKWEKNYLLNNAHLELDIKIYYQPSPHWARTQVGCNQLSCSS